VAAPVVISLLVGLVAGGAFMAMWAANRIEEEGVRQFDRGFERGRWLTDLSVAKAIEDQDRARRVGLLVAGPASPAARQPPAHPVRSPARRCSSSPSDGTRAAADRYRAAPARAGSVTRSAVTAAGGWVRRPRADRRSMASSTARV
jgi:hypothetical protein